MLRLDETHDPYQNGQLIAEYTETKSNKEAVLRAEQLMNDSPFVAPRRTTHPSRYLRSLISPLFLTDRDRKSVV